MLKLLGACRRTTYLMRRMQWTMPERVHCRLLGIYSEHQWKMIKLYMSATFQLPRLTKLELAVQLWHLWRWVGMHVCSFFVVCFCFHFTFRSINTLTEDAFHSLGAGAKLCYRDCAYVECFAKEEPRPRCGFLTCSTNKKYRNQIHSNNKHRYLSDDRWYILLSIFGTYWIKSRTRPTLNGFNMGAS